MSKLLYEKRDRIAYVTINRREARNAIDPDVHRGMIEAWTDFAADDSGEVAILTGAGDEAFCAGADLRTYIPPIMESARPHDIREIVELGLNGFTRGMHRIPKPIVAAVNGWSLAGGLETALACDIRVASARQVRVLRGPPRLPPRRRRRGPPGQRVRGRGGLAHAAHG